MNDEPKIIIDEDWKSQVEREKEALRAKQGIATPSSTHSPAGEADPGTATATDSADAQAHAPPAASFALLVTTLATQVLAALGVLDEETAAGPPRLAEARHLIDLLGVLETKTRGNLDRQEEAMLTGALHQLRLAFVEVQRHQGAKPA